MRDLDSPVLPAAIVAGLTGLPLRTLARWRTLGVVPRRARTAGGRYSWTDVERLQRAAHFVRVRRLPLTEVIRLLARPAAAVPLPQRIAARPKPQSRRRVVAIALPRSAKRITPRRPAR
jgi:DNA-binding transcriptional MerR regulator